MEIIAKAKSVRISPRKASLIADSIRGMSVTKAQNVLSLIPKRAGIPIQKTLKSAIANAVNNAKKDKENLRIKRIEITPGAALKRFKPSTRGRVHPYKKRSSHIKIVLEEAYGTKS